MVCGSRRLHLPGRRRKRSEYLGLALGLVWATLMTGRYEHPEGVSEFIIRIDPAAGCARVTLHRAYDTASSDWNAYFECEARPSPVLNFTVEGDTVSLVWNKVPDTRSYTLVFSPYPAMSPVTGVDLGPRNRRGLSSGSGDLLRRSYSRRQG